MLEYWLCNGSNMIWEILAHTLGHPLVAHADLNKVAKKFQFVYDFFASIIMLYISGNIQRLIVSFKYCSYLFHKMTSYHNVPFVQTNIKSNSSIKFKC